MLVRVGQGHSSYKNSIMEQIYPHLHEIAERHIRKENAPTIQATELVHEAYLKLIDQNIGSWQNRNHFLAISSNIMRKILIDRARKRKSLKRGGDCIQVTLSAASDSALPCETEDQLLAIDSALERLKKISERQHQIVELRFFGGMEINAIADVMQLSPSTVKRDLRVAKAWINKELAD